MVIIKECGVCGNNLPLLSQIVFHKRDFIYDRDVMLCPNCAKAFEEFRKSKEAELTAKKKAAKEKNSFLKRLYRHN